MRNAGLGLSALSEAAMDSRTWLFETALPLWSTLGRCPGGGFVDQIGQDGRPLDMPKRCRVQARQAFVFAEAGRMGWSGPWKECLGAAIDFMLDHYLRPDGFMRFKVDRSGAIVDDLIDNYDQAFAIFALAQAYQWTPDPNFIAVARGIAQALETRRNPAGGYHEGGIIPHLISNTHMHLFEAALAWLEADVEDPFRGMAEEIAGLCAHAFVDPASGALREFFDAAWKPAQGPKGDTVEPGHQFEWAWLLERWVGLGAPSDLTAAKRLHGFAERYGIDRERHVAINEVDPNGTPRDGTARLWPQTERMKGALAMARRTSEANERDRLYGEAADSWVGLARYWSQTRPGLFYDKMRPDGSFIEEAAFASSMYHIVCALADLQSAAARAREIR